MNHYLIFTLDEEKYALNINSVEMVLRVIEIKPLPELPDIVLGIVNIQGKIMPVINIRKRFLLPYREVDLNDKLIVGKTSKRTVAMVVNGITDIIGKPEKDIIKRDEILDNIKYVEGVMKLGDDIILIHNLDDFLSPDEEKFLEGI